MLFYASLHDLYHRHKGWHSVENLRIFNSFLDYVILVCLGLITFYLPTHSDMYLNSFGNAATLILYLYYSVWILPTYINRPDNVLCAL